MNASVINGANLSTATMRLSSDFSLDTFNNTLNFEGETGADAVRDLEDNGLTTVSIDTDSLTVSGFSNVNVLGVGLLLSSATNFLYNINSSGTWNTSTLNVSTINASSITGYQQSLIAGTGITLNGNTISVTDPLPTDANFSSVNASTINSSSAIIDSMTVNDIQSSLISATENITSPQCDIGNISCNNLTATTLVESDEANFSTYNFIVGVGDELDVNTLTASLATINTINVSGTANISTGNFSTIDVIDGNIDTLTNGKITSTDRIIINNIQPTLY